MPIFFSLTEDFKKKKKKGGFIRIEVMCGSVGVCLCVGWWW